MKAKENFRSLQIFTTDQMYEYLSSQHYYNIPLPGQSYGHSRSPDSCLLSPAVVSVSVTPMAIVIFIKCDQPHQGSVSLKHPYIIRIIFKYLRWRWQTAGGIESNSSWGRNIISLIFSSINLVLIRYMYDYDGNGVLDQNDFECLAVRNTILEGCSHYWCLLIFCQCIGV